MENNVVHHLREWAPLTILEKIPTKVLHGIFPNDLNITCIDAISEYLALGTDDGLIFWYNRYNAELQKLRTEVSSPITCIKIVSSVEYMVASGTRNDQITVFQIQKEIPPDLQLSAPLARSKPIQRYTVKDLHKASITCCEWSKNGMKLFSADKSGMIVLTEFDYQNNAAKSVEILNEPYSVIQLSLFQSYLLVSTLQRTVICEVDKSKQSNSEWRISQIGKTDRKVLGEFGAVFKVEDLKPPSIVACRPGFRFWLANCEGTVEKTFIFKEAPLIRPTWEIPLLNPNRKSTNVRLKNFTRIYPYLKKFFVTNDDVSIYILNLEELKIEAIARNFRKILDYAICGNEIFVLEGGRSLIRLSNKPEPPNLKATIIFNPLLPPPIPHMGIFEAPIEFTEEENIGAEECFELPPMEPISLDIQIQTHINSPDTETKKIVEENRQRIEILQKIGQEAFEKEILFHSAKKNKMFPNQRTRKSKSNKTEGIIEIGCTAMEIFKTEHSNLASATQSEPKEEVMEQADKPEGNLCLDIITQFKGDVVNLKNEQTANNIDATSKLALPKPLMQMDPCGLQLPALNYPLLSSGIDPTSSSDTLTNESERLTSEKMELLNNEDSINEILSASANKELSLIQSDEITSTQDFKINKNIQQSDLNILLPQLGGRDNQLQTQNMPEDFKIPPIFNSNNENFKNNSQDTGGSDSNETHSEWEFVNDGNKNVDSDVSYKMTN